MKDNEEFLLDLYDKLFGRFYHTAKVNIAKGEVRFEGDDWFFVFEYSELLYIWLHGSELTIELEDEQ